MCITATEQSSSWWNMRIAKNMFIVNSLVNHGVEVRFDLVKTCMTKKRRILFCNVSLVTHLFLYREVREPLKLRFKEICLFFRLFKKLLNIICRGLRGFAIRNTHFPLVLSIKFLTWNDFCRRLRLLPSKSNINIFTSETLLWALKLFQEVR